MSLFRKHHDTVSDTDSKVEASPLTEAEARVQASAPTEAQAVKAERWPTLINVEEFRDGDTLVVTAELPGYDPDKDVEVTVDDGRLTIVAKHTEESETTDQDFRRHEVHYGYFKRTVPLGDGVDPSAVQASFHDGTLEVRTPVPAEAPTNAARRIPVTT